MSINHRDTAICFRLLCYPQELGKGAILCLLVDERARKCGTYMFYVAIKKDEIMVYVKKNGWNYSHYTIRNKSDSER